MHQADARAVAYDSTARREFLVASLAALAEPDEIQVGLLARLREGAWSQWQTTKETDPTAPIASWIT